MITTGYKNIDNLIGGVTPKTINLVMGESGSGKTHFLCKLASEAVNKGKVVVYLSGNEKLNIPSINVSHYKRNLIQVQSISNGKSYIDDREYLMSMLRIKNINKFDVLILDSIKVPTNMTIDYSVGYTIFLSTTNGNELKNIFDTTFSLSKTNDLYDCDVKVNSCPLINCIESFNINL